MDKELLYDDILKEKASKEILPLPNSLELLIKNTIANLPDNRKKKSNYLKNIGIAASIALIAVFGLSTVFPVFARNLPVTGSVFQLLSEKNIIDKAYVNYSKDLNLLKSSNGVRVTINNISYDGIQLGIGYTVESEKELKTDPFIFKSSIKINGKAINTATGGTGLFKDRNTYVGFAHFNVDYNTSAKDSSGSIKILDEFIMDLNISELVGGINGQWGFKFKVLKEDIELKSKNIKTDINLSALRPGLKINEVILTPISTFLRTSEQFEGGFYGDKGGYLIFDNNGRKINSKSASGSGSVKTRTYNNQLVYSSVPEDSQSITVIPYNKLQLKKDNSSGAVPIDVKEVSLNQNSNTILQEGKLGEYKITQIDFQKERTLIHYECSDLLSLLSYSKLWVVDANNKEYAFYEGIVKEEVSDSNRYVVELPYLDKVKSYKLRAIDYEKRYEIRDDLKFTIKLK